MRLPLSLNSRLPVIGLNSESPLQQLANVATSSYCQPAHPPLCILARARPAMVDKGYTKIRTPFLASDPTRLIGIVPTSTLQHHDSTSSTDQFSHTVVQLDVHSPGLQARASQLYDREELPRQHLSPQFNKGSNHLLRRPDIDEEEFTSEISLPNGIDPSEKLAILRKSHSSGSSSTHNTHDHFQAHKSGRSLSPYLSLKGHGLIPSFAICGQAMDADSPKKFVSFAQEKPGFSIDIPQTPAIISAKRAARPKTYSQATRSKDNVKNEHRPGRGIRSDEIHSMQEGNFNIFRTRSRKLSPLRSVHEHTYKEGQDIPNGGLKFVPAERYFDALKGPELQVLKNSEETLLPLDQKWPFLLRFPIACFGISLGLGSQAYLWKTLAEDTSLAFLHVPKLLNLILWCLSLSSLVIIFITYSFKCIFFFEAVRREYNHPVRSNFFFAPWVACIFLTLGVPPVIATSLHPVLWCLCMTPIFILELKVYGQWFSGGERRLSKVANPSTHLSLVGNFLGSLLASKVHWHEAAIFFWAVGAIHYIVLFVTLYQRLPTTEAIPKELHPVFFLFVAAPCTAGIAWQGIVGDFDNVSRSWYFVGLFLYSSLVVRLNFFRGFPFSISWWAYLYPMTSSAIATIHYSHKVNHPLAKALAIILSMVSAITVFGLFLSTVLHGVFLHTLFPNDIAIAITAERYTKKSKKKNKKQDYTGKNKTDSSLTHPTPPIPTMLEPPHYST